MKNAGRSSRIVVMASLLTTAGSCSSSREMTLELRAWCATGAPSFEAVLVAQASVNASRATMRQLVESMETPSEDEKAPRRRSSAPLLQGRQQHDDRTTI